MKKILIFLCAVTLVFGIVATASAISFTYKDTYKFGQFMKKGDRVKWEHDITDTGFNPTTQDGM